MSTPTLPTLTPAELNALAAALIDPARTPAAIAQDFKLDPADLGTLAQSPEITQRIAALETLEDLHDRATHRAASREALQKLRAIVNSENETEARHAATTILRKSTLPKEGLGWVRSQSPKAAPAAGSLTTQHSQTSITATTTRPPLPPRTRYYPTDPDSLVAAIFEDIKHVDPRLPEQGFKAIYEICSLKIKMGGPARDRFIRRLEGSLLLNHHHLPHNDPPADLYGPEPRTTPPPATGADHHPLQTAIKRITFQRENGTPLGIRFHINLEKPFPQTPPRWGIDDIAIDSS